MLVETNGKPFTLDQLKFIAAFEEVDGFELFAASLFFGISHVLEWGTVRTQIEANEFHDALAADDIAAVVADDVDDLLCEVLQFAFLLDIASVPSVDDAYEVASIVVGSTTDTALCTTHSE